MEEAIWRILEKIDWEEVTLELIDHADIKVRRLKWKTESNEDLPQGKRVEDIAQEAILKTLSGERKWDPERYPDILIFLKLVVDSFISHLVNSQNHKMIQRFPENENGESLESMFSTDNSPTPEDEIIAYEMLDKIYEAIDGDTELQSIMDAIMAGYTKSRDIAEVTGFDVNHVYQLRRKLDRRFSKLKKI
jgi:DNA-directed RNA polymerase specialized sigma24 family protein